MNKYVEYVKGNKSNIGFQLSSMYKNINCYAYALGLFFDPLYLEDSPNYSLRFMFQPGTIESAIKENRSINDRENEFNDWNEEEYTNALYRDILALGGTIEETTKNAIVPKDKWKIYFVFQTFNSAFKNGYYIGDYHFYKQNNNGLWSHKPGPQKIAIQVKNPEKDVKIGKKYNNKTGKYYLISLPDKYYSILKTYINKYSPYVHKEKLNKILEEELMLV